MNISYGKRSSIKVRLDVLYCSDNCQKFTPCCAVNAFGFTECMAVIGYDLFLTIVNLRKKCPYANITASVSSRKGSSLRGYASTGEDTRADLSS